MKYFTSLVIACLLLTACVSQTRTDSQTKDICQEVNGVIVPINSEDAQEALDVICGQTICCVK